jgi:phage tail sheath protein FI
VGTLSGLTGVHSLPLACVPLWCTIDSHLAGNLSMPTEYLAPGVYVEEISSGPKPIEGVPTSTAGLVGAARYGPVRLAPAALTSLAEFERSYAPFGATGGALQFEGAADSRLPLARRARLLRRRRYRFALLDSAEGQTIAEVRALRARFDTTHAALYYPWITVPDPLTAAPLQLPPSGWCARPSAWRHRSTRASRRC